MDGRLYMLLSHLNYLVEQSEVMFGGIKEPRTLILHVVCWMLNSVRTNVLLTSVL